MYHEIKGSTILKKHLENGSQFFEILTGDKYLSNMISPYRHTESFDVSFNTETLPNAWSKRIEFHEIWKQYPIVDSFLKMEHNKYISN